jgi:hypothetical protein
VGELMVGIGYLGAKPVVAPDQRCLVDNWVNYEL